MNTQTTRSPEELETYKLHRRFDRLGRLVGDSGMQKLMSSHVMIVGLGGVGSWAAESVARSGVGHITVIDFDTICVTNFNRQLHALGKAVGSPKAGMVQERLASINPSARVEAIEKFYDASNSDSIFLRRPDFVIDAIDNMTAKAHLVNHCRSNKIPIVVSTGSGGRMDPTRIEIEDLAFTSVDPLARELRKILRQKYSFPPDVHVPFGVPSVYSREPATDPIELHYDKGKGFQCVCPQGDNPFFTCDSRNVIMGNASFVTGAFGLAAASVAIRHLLGNTLKPQTETR